MYEKSEYEQWMDELNKKPDYRLSKMIGTGSFALSIILLAWFFWSMGV